MRILILTQYYAPEPVFKFTDLAQSLRARGHEVQVLTGFPCYPAGRTYAGFRQQLFAETTIDGVLVTRLPQFPDHSRSALRRAIYYLSFALSAATIGLWRARRADVLLVYQSAFPVGLAAWIIGRVKRMPYVLDVVDLWPESVAASGMMRNRVLLSIIRRCMRFIYQHARHVNVITEGYWHNLVALGVRAEKLSLIHCWPPAGQFDPLPRDPALAQTEKLAGRFNVLYAGTMGPVQDLRTVIDAAVLLGDFPQVQFVMIGDGVEHQQLVALAAERGATNVCFLGRRPPIELRRLFPLADALLVHLKRDPLSSVSIPSKTFDYMAAGRPILMAVAGEAARLVEQHACGVTVPPSDPQALADAVRRLVAMPAHQRQRMADAALAAYCRNYHADIQINRFESLLHKTAFGCEPILRQAA